LSTIILGTEPVIDSILNWERVRVHGPHAGPPEQLLDSDLRWTISGVQQRFINPMFQQTLSAEFAKFVRKCTGSEVPDNIATLFFDVCRKQAMSNQRQPRLTHQPGTTAALSSHNQLASLAQSFRASTDASSLSALQNVMKRFTLLRFVYCKLPFGVITTPLYPDVYAMRAWANPVASQLYGYSPEEFVSIMSDPAKVAARMYEPAEYIQFTQYFARFVGERRKQWTVKIRMRRADGILQPILLSTSVNYAQCGMPVFATFFFQLFR
jgi:PAS domain-containing protein